ncbi:uncharacterized protein [Haliotis asinina]|uniref:uncharacterized protein isoform X1 n=1 Tax=Haliotis asinina TaxID=109174 RepID=UPI0035320B75
MSDGGVVVTRPSRILRCRTAVGVLGEDWKEFSAVDWATENRVRFRPVSCADSGRRRSQLMLTKLDGGRRHNPHAGLARHIDQLHGKKPVCAVQTLLKEPTPDKTLTPSMYTTQFEYRKPPEPRLVIFRRDKEKKAVGIVPKNNITSRTDIRDEMMLPVCESLEMPSMENPHTYFPRRKRVSTPYQEEGVFYSESHCAKVCSAPTGGARIGITNLTGKEFTRRRFVAPPRNTLTVKGFDGGLPPTDNATFQSEMMPFMRAKTII